MTQEEWPLSALSAVPRARSACGESARLRTVRADFLLDPAERLSEQERAVMTAMLHHLIEDGLAALYSRLPGEWCGERQQLEPPQIANGLARTHQLDDPDLIASLLRRADEDRIAKAARSRGGPEQRLLQGLVSHHGEAVAAAAMKLIVGQARRRDRFGQFLLMLDDLTVRAAEALLFGIAACCRSPLAARYGAAGVDRALSAAASDLLGAQEPGRSEKALTDALVTALRDAGAVENTLILAAASEGEARIAAHLLAARAHIDPDHALDDLTSRSPERMALLFRMAEAPRSLFAGFLAAVADMFGVADVAQAMRHFDAVPQADVEAARAWLGTDRAYRAAAAAIGEFDG